MKFSVSCPLLNLPRRNRSSSWANRTSPAQYPHGRLARLPGVGSVVMWVDHCTTVAIQPRLRAAIDIIGDVNLAQRSLAVSGFLLAVWLANPAAYHAKP